MEGVCHLREKNVIRKNNFNFLYKVVDDVD